MAPSLVLPPSGEGRLTVTFFPLIVKPQPTVARLVLSCPELGEFPYALNLITAGGPLASIGPTASRGGGG